MMKYISDTFVLYEAELPREPTRSLVNLEQSRTQVNQFPTIRTQIDPNVGFSRLRFISNLKLEMLNLMS